MPGLPIARCCYNYYYNYYYFVITAVIPNAQYLTDKGEHTTLYTINKNGGIFMTSDLLDFLLVYF